MESIEYLDALVNNYLDSARTENLFSAEAQEAILDQERFPVQMVIDAVREMFELESVERGLELRTVNSSLWLKGDAIAILRIVSNLVKNAIEHAAQGKVLLGCRRQTGACVINVVDTGVGIPDNELERLRLAFEQGTDAGDGHGLGLHIVDDLCRKNGHTFSIESRPGRGTRVAVSIALA
jgi:signal transduction histidine kinase